MTLLEAKEPKTYVINKINSEEDDVVQFLFRLGCYSGENITLLSKKRKGCVVVIKDARYSIDDMLASMIVLEQEA